MKSKLSLFVWKIILILIGIFFSMASSYALTSTGKILEDTGSGILSNPIEFDGTGSKYTKYFTETKSGSLENDITKSDEEAQEEQKLKQEINTYIIESYKAQWSKIIKDLSLKLSKTIPDKADRKEAYEKIQSSLETRLEKTEKLKMSETKKTILKEFLGHMIELLGKKIDELE